MLWYCWVKHWNQKQEDLEKKISREENNDLVWTGEKSGVWEGAACPVGALQMIVDNGENMETKRLTHKKVNTSSSKC